MKVSGFTFLRNGQLFGYPFVESIRSILPIVDEFVVALGPCEDQTEEMVRAIGDPKIRIINTAWNERIRNDLRVKGFVYGQQKSIALFNCTGDWAFYLEADEVVHEAELDNIRRNMEKHLDNPEVEALIFDYLHFYVNQNTYVWSPRFYRTAPRVLRNTIPAWGPKGLYFVVLKDHKRSRWPQAARAGATIYHYGWVRSQEQMNAKSARAARYWNNKASANDYGEIDASVLKPFKGTHPAVMKNWLPPADGIYQPNLAHRLTRRERKHRLMLLLERAFGLELSKKHYRLVA